MKKKFVSRDVLKCYAEKVSVDFEDSPSGVLHTELAKETDLLIIILAIANTISKIAHGIADNLLITTALTYNL